MAYTPATKLPTLNFFQWSRPDAPNPRLSAPIDDDDTTLTFTSAPKDYTGTVITGHFLMNVTNESGYTELIYVPAGGMSVDGLTATGCIRGVRISGLDYTTGDATLADTHEGDSVIGCAVNAVYEALVQGVLQGTIATGAAGITIGTEPGAGGETTTIYRTTTAGAKQGFFRWTANKAQYSNDGTAWVNVDSVSASNLVTVSAADTTPSYLQNKINAGDGLDEAIGTPAGDETLDLSVDVTDFIDTNYGLTENSNNIRVNLAADPGLEFSGGGLRALVDPAGGISRGAAGLALTNADTMSLTTGEAIDGSVTPKAAFISQGTTASDTFPLQVQETENDTDIDIYGVRYGCQTFTTGTFQNRITKVDLLLMRVVAGAIAGNILVNIYAVDGAHKPTGASLGSATYTANNPSTSYLEWVSFAIAINVTPATEYAITMSVISGDAANYIEWQTGNGDTYSGGQPFLSTDAGGTWGAGANDYTFRVWGYEAQTAGYLYQSDSDEPFRGAVDGFVTSNTGAGASATMAYRGKLGSFVGLTTGAPYYVSSTIGGIATSGGLKVGKAVSATEIDIDFSDGFVEKAVVTIGALQTTVTTPVQYQVYFNCGFKPSKCELQIRGTAEAAGAGDDKQIMFDGTYVSSLYGIAVTTVGDGATCTTDLTSNASSLSAAASGGSTITIGTFGLTQTGLRCLYSTGQQWECRGSIQGKFYR